MKTWEEAAVVEMNIAETQHGGNACSVFDNSWTDNKGALHVQFEANVLTS